MTSKAFRALMLASLLTSPAFASRPPAPDDPLGATILCYHIVQSPQDPRMEISREVFQQQMRYLEMTGYTVVPLQHVYEYAAGKRASLPKNSVAITIDDGWRSTYTEAFPELKKRHFPFTVFIYPNIIGKTAYALTWKQVKEMADAGVDIESHSYSHPYLTQRRQTTLDEKQYGEWLHRELVESKKILERETGKNVSFLAYPYGDYDYRLTTRVLKAGYDGALTCDYGKVTRGTDPLRLRRVVIDKKMDFATFRRYLGARSLPIEEMSPPPGHILDPGGPVMISARIPNYKELDPISVGMALVSTGGPVPYAYDAQNGLISLVISEELTGSLQRALVWGTEMKTGRRVEASWTFRHCPPVDPAPVPQTSPALSSSATTVSSHPQHPHPAGAPRLQN
jgi:peptidoglycan/xylan/chitin deacetylase (PgdA/CDA1 family)